MFTEVKIYKADQNADRQPTKEECQEIIQMLNNRVHHKRIPLKQEDCEDIKLDYNDHCHATARKIADLNKDREWERVSGYLFCRDDKEKLQKGHDILTTLKHHSVIKDNHDNFIETMEIIYPLDKYFFIIHDSGLLGWDLQAF